MAFGLPELAAAVRQFMAESLPGRHAKRLLIVTLEDDEPLSVPVALGPPSVEAISHSVPSSVTQPPPPPSRPEDERGRSLSPCVLDMLRTFREVGKPLSKTRLLEEMGKRGMEWSERTVSTHLKNLMEDGTLENPDEARPRGYRLIELESTSGD